MWFGFLLSAHVFFYSFLNRTLEMMLWCHRVCYFHTVSHQNVRKNICRSLGSHTHELGVKIWSDICNWKKLLRHKKKHKVERKLSLLNYLERWCGHMSTSSLVSHKPLLTSPEMHSCGTSVWTPSWGLNNASLQNIHTQTHIHTFSSNDSLIRGQTLKLGITSLWSLPRR